MLHCINVSTPKNAMMVDMCMILYCNTSEFIFSTIFIDYDHSLSALFFTSCNLYLHDPAIKELHVFANGLYCVVDILTL